MPNEPSHSDQSSRPSAGYAIATLVIVLVILHQDFWFWDNGTLVFGFMPITLLYHAGISVAASITWFLATKFAWDESLDGLDNTHSDHTIEEGGQAE